MVWGFGGSSVKRGGQKSEFAAFPKININTLPKLNSEFTPEKLPKPKRKGSSSNHHFSGAMLSFQGVFLKIDGWVR